MMTSKSVLLTVLLLLTISINVYSQQDRWKQLKPMESTLSDVEKLLGKTKVGAYLAFYDLDEGKYMIEYSDGKCNPEWAKDWDIPEWTVVEVSYYPYEEPKVSSFKIKWKKLKKTENLHTPGIFKYTDELNGISYSVENIFELKADVVSGIKLFPEAKYNHLLCKGK